MSKTEAQRRADRLTRFSRPTEAALQDNLHLLLSPSRGENANEQSLRDPHIQQTYRQYLGKELDTYDRRFSKFDAWKAPGRQRETLVNILLDFRKLREGLVASGRRDAFTVEVYETSIRLAIYAQHDATLLTTYPSLVRHYHNPLWRSNSLEDKVEALSLHESIDNRCFYASLALLHTVCNRASKREFCTLFSDLTCPSSSVYAEPFAPLPASHPHLQLARRAFLAHARNDYASLRRLLLQKDMHETQRLLLLNLALKIRNTTLDVLCKAYMSLPRSWMKQQLLLDVSVHMPPAEEELKALLKSLPWLTDTSIEVIALRPKR